jgi:molybdopterin-guanine dinucleotide biosynthesis protein
MRSALVAVGGFESSVGKTTLVCELLRGLRGWEAIKMTRGHYRSCGKSAHACCVSHLLGAEPSVRSGRAETYEAGKDTGLYWDAGASNVHWVIATDAQVARGIESALARVEAPGVVIEGNSFLDFVSVDFALVVARASGGKIKPSARRALEKASAVYLSSVGGETDESLREHVSAWRAAHGEIDARLPVYTRLDLPRLVARLDSLPALGARARAELG